MTEAVPAPVGYSPLTDPSQAALIAGRLVAELGRDGAHRALDVMLAQFSTVELAALGAEWEFWARPKQLHPKELVWRVLGFLAGRGFGKTVANSNFVNREVEAGRAKMVCLIAQDKDNTIGIQVNGPSGLIATAPPWFKPVYVPSEEILLWPNGAKGIVRTPEKPGKIRGFDYDLTWMIELQSWPKAQQKEALMNVRFATRVGLARIVWDATAKKGHELLLELLADAVADPVSNIVVRGHTNENATNLNEAAVAALEKKYAGTQAGREELGGEMLENSDKATAKQEWIDRNRRPAPTHLVRCGVSVDPAVSTKAGSDTTGIVVGGIAPDGKLQVKKDLTGKYSPEEWGKVALDEYIANDCDCIVVERNKAGDFVASNIRSAARNRKLTVIVLGKTERPQRVKGVVYIREVYGQGEKSERAKPVGTAYEQDLIAHDEDADLRRLELTLTTWEPSPSADSPGDLDALVHLAVEMLGLTASIIDKKMGFEGLGDAQKLLTEKAAAGTKSHGLGADAMSRLRRGGGRI